jgi:hypothetical protein
MRRATACGMKTIKVMFFIAWFQASLAIEGLHPLQGGYLRLKYRKDRRSGFRIEPPVLWHLKYFGESVAKIARLLSVLWRLDRTRRRILKDPKRMEYKDLAITPVQEGEMDELEIFNVTEGGRAAVAKVRHQAELLHSPAAKPAPVGAAS